MPVSRVVVVVGAVTVAVPVIVAVAVAIGRLSRATPNWCRSTVSLMTAYAQLQSMCVHLRRRISRIGARREENRRTLVLLRSRKCSCFSVQALP